MSKININQPILSVIIPCYNQGDYLPEIVDCFPNYLEQNVYEVIFVNDGSTDKNTLKILKNIKSQGFQVLHQENQGLCITRNNGIKLSKGKYILPLDGDDKISPKFIFEAIDVFNNNPEYSVVYCNGEYFNERSGPWLIGKFNLQRLMLWNYLPSCSVFRKSAWEQAKGYDPKVNGLEDWDLWLSIAFSGGKFYYLEKTFFYYRITPNSATQTATSIRYNELLNYIEKKHESYLGKEYLSDHITLKIKHNKNLWIKLFLKIYFPKYLNGLVNDGKLNSSYID